MPRKAKQKRSKGSAGTKKPIGLSGKYIYAIAQCANDKIYQIPGIGNANVYTIRQGDFGAIVSDIFTPTVRPERRNLSAHRMVLNRLMQDATILPVRFGVIARNANALHKLLANNEAVIEAQLERVAGKVEMGLRVNWDVANIYEFFVNEHPVLREERDRIFGDRQRRNIREEKIELGGLYERILEEKRIVSLEKVEEILQEVCSEVIAIPIKKEKEVLNLACLVDKDDMEGFERSVFEASKLFDNHYLFDIIGPWAPHNFVDINLDAVQGQGK